MAGSGLAINALVDMKLAVWQVNIRKPERASF
jgi:hypothetical protein